MSTLKDFVLALLAYIIPKSTQRVNKEHRDAECQILSCIQNSIHLYF